MSMLFDSTKVDRLTCPNRIWMAALICAIQFPANPMIRVYGFTENRA
ncbi:MAG TPA: hypothetical protein VE267_14010 [Bradyrhizobium sp.]|nr:hypothetical protein [Bradyrhizobium sp.]